ncbi:MAG: hypothetical protein SGI77_06650 [Pirellulaceae bacterium]|nr:hypothetical protein [Pirellulaceae bacterium]
MSIVPTGTSVRRTWTQEESNPAGNRFSVMAILAVGIIGLTAMVLYIVIWSGAKTCAVSISITDYGQRFPKPKFGVWQSEEFKAIVASVGAKEWTFNRDLELTKLQNTGDIKDKLAILPGLLKTNDLRDQDTVIVQLRCHARIAKGPDNEWSCGLIVRENDQNDTIPIEEFLSELQSVQAKNIVLLADVCDLKSLPSRGLFANPIASYLLKACEKIPKNNNNPTQSIWVVCSAADFQTAHVSETRQKTLFQDACEHALGRVENGNLFLADYYEQIFQYCHVATRGKQTPLLMRAGDKQLCTPNNASWKSAKEAIVSWKGRKAKVPAVVSDKAKSAIPVKAQKTSQSPIVKNPRIMRLVAMQQKPIDPSSSTAPDAAPSEPIPEPVETDSTLRFWQLRGEFQDRKLAPWSPIDFAPQLWRRQQSDYAKSTPHLDDLSDLEELKLAMASDSPIEARGDLTKAWNNFRESNKVWRLWETYSEFTADDQAAWTRIKNEYYRYLSLCDELMHWRDWALEQIELRDKEDIDLKEIKSEYQTLYQALKDAQDYLPFQTTEFALDKSKRLNLSKAEAAKGKLKALLGKRIQYARENWESQELTWLHEREFQTLVHSPLLSLRERKELLGLKKASNYQKPVKAAEGNLSNLTTDGYWRSIRMEWAELIQSSVDLIPELNVNRISQSVDSYDQLLDWGNTYVQRLSDFETDASKSPLALWHSLCFRELGIEDGVKLTKSYSGIVVMPTNSRAISMSLVPDRQEIDGVDFPYGQRRASLNLDIQQADGEKIDECKLEWNSNASELRELQVFVEHNDAFVPFERGKKIDVQPRNKRVQLQFELPPNRYIDGQATLTFIASRTDGKSTDSRIVNVTSDAERIGLEARQILAVGEPLKPTIIFDPTTPTFEFDFIALKDAVCQYSFTLVNKIQQPRYAKLRIRADLEGDGNEKTIAESDLVTIENGERKEAILKILPEEKKKLIFQIATGQMFFEIIECDIDGNPHKKAPARIQAKFTALNPKNFLDIASESPTANRKTNFTVKAKPQERLWERTSLKQILVSVDWESVDGNQDPEKKDIPTPLPTRPLTPKDPLHIEGPLAIPDSLVQFQFHIGGYARALSLTADATPKKEQIYLSGTRRTRINAITLIENDDPQIKYFQIVDDTIYFKKFLPSGEEVTYRGLTMQCELDLENSIPAILSIDLDGKPQIPQLQIDKDRTCFAEVTLPEGMLELKFDVSELVLTEKKLFLNPTVNGLYTVTLMNGEKSDRRYIVFDQDKPNKGSLELNKPNRIAKFNSERTPILYEKGIISAIMNSRDDLSGVERIEVAISNLRSDKARFTDDDKPLASVHAVPRDSTQREFEFDIKALEFEKLSKGDYWIVARSYDRAGNHQNDNEPLKIHWSQSEAPQEK